MLSFPIVVIERESGEVYLFRDAAHAEGYLEAIDVENGEYEAFDSAGVVQTFSIVGTPGREQVEISPDPDATTAPDSLRAKLKRYFDAMSEWRPEYESMDLPTLVQHLLRRFAR